MLPINSCMHPYINHALMENSMVAAKTKTETQMPIPSEDVRAGSNDDESDGCTFGRVSGKET